MPTLSVVIPTMNEEDYLPRILVSIKSQTLRPLEVIIADAGSTDRTREIAESFGARIVSGGMPGEGRNRGAEAARGDLIFFFDADVELRDEQFLENAVTSFENASLDVATADVTPINGSTFDDVSHQIYNFYVRLVGKWRPHAPGFCLLVRKSLHEAIDGFDETVVFAEDQDYAFRGSRVGKFGFLPKSLQIHVSTRRQKRDGYVSMYVKYILAELHMLFIGPIRHDKFNYTFGYTKDN